MKAAANYRAQTALAGRAVLWGWVLGTACVAAGAKPKAATGSVQQLERGFVASVEKVEKSFASVIEDFEKRFEKALVAVEKEFEEVLTGLERRPQDKRLRGRFTVLQDRVGKLGQEVEKLKRTAQFLESEPETPKRPGRR